MRLLAIVVLACGAASAQTLQFDVASVKPDGQVQRPGPGNVQGGPGTTDPTRINYNFATLKLLVQLAYGMEDYQVSGPKWIESERYTINAKVPERASKEQVSAMLRSLLEERFKLKVHRDTKVFSVYELTVAKGGPKLRPSPGDAKTLGQADYGELKYVDGIPQLPAGSSGQMTGGTPGGVVMLAAAHRPVSTLLSFLQARLQTVPGDHQPVIDKTGLTGDYDFGLRFMAPLPVAPNADGTASDPAPDVFTAVQQYLGLKLEAKKDPLDVVVVDSAEKVPLED